MTDEGGAGGRAAPRHDVERARRQARLERNLSEEQGRQRRFGRRLQDHGAPGSERRGEFPARDVEREIPRHDRTDDADRPAAYQDGPAHSGPLFLPGERLGLFGVPVEEQPARSGLGGRDA